MTTLFFNELMQFSMGWQALLAGVCVLFMLSLLLIIPMLQRPQFARLLARTLMAGPTLYCRLLVGFRFVAIVPVLTLLPLLAVISTATVENMQLPQVERLAESLSVSLPPLIKSKITGLEMLSGHIAAAENSSELALSGALLRHHATSTEFASLWVARMSGDIVVASAVKDGQSVPWSGPVAGVGMLRSFKQAVIKGGLYVSPVEKGATTDAAPMVFVSVPIALDGNPRWGFLQGLLNLRKVVGGLVSQGGVDSASVIITDQQNRVILTSKGLVLEPFSDLSGHPLVTEATIEGVYRFSGTVNNDGNVSRYIAVSKPLDNGWRVITTAIRARADLTLLIYLSLGLIWSLLAVFLARGLAPLYGHVVAEPLQKLEESLDAFDAERTLSIIPSPPEDAPKEIRQTYARVRESMRSSRDAYRNMMKAVNEGIELRQQLSTGQGSDSNTADAPVRPVASAPSPGSTDLAVAPESSMPDATWIGRLDSVTELSGLDVFEGFFGEAWALGVTDSRPMAVILLRIGATDDQTIKLIAQKIKTSVGRTLDLVARISAWEFGMILPDTDASGALSIATRVRESIQGDTPGQPTTIGFGVGAIVPNENGNAQSILDLCHRALDTAIQAGDGQVAYINDKGKLILHSSDDMIDWDPGTTRISV